METNINCEKCGKIMDRVDPYTIECGGCGNTINVEENK